ncbi:hypothetical protein Tco_1247014 [Tanacetum coccineum]
MVMVVVRWNEEGCDEGGGEVCRLWCGEDGRNQAGNGDMGDDVDINTLTIEQYLALIQDNIRQDIIFYTGLDIPSRIRLDSKGFIPLMSPAQAIKSIQVMVDHSHNWYDEVTTRESINNSSDNIDMKKLKENIHVIQVSRKSCEGAHPTNDCPLTKENNVVEQSKYMRSLEETIIKFYEE